jgi:hypothetical protein
VLELADQRDRMLAALDAERAAAEARMRVTVHRLSAAFGIRETARRLGVPESTVAALAHSAPLTPADRRALSGTGEPLELPN